jgi:transcription initiation factor IIF auxiliary subunit
MKIAQEEHYQGDDWWVWKVWIDAPAAELKEVNSVAWHLHPSFDPKDVEVDDRASKFALQTSGWGTFRVRATVKLKDGTVRKLVHELELSYPDGSAAQA